MRPHQKVARFGNKTTTSDGVFVVMKFRLLFYCRLKNYFFSSVMLYLSTSSWATCVSPHFGHFPWRSTKTSSRTCALLRRLFWFKLACKRLAHVD